MGVERLSRAGHSTPTLTLPLPGGGEIWYNTLAPSPLQGEGWDEGRKQIESGETAAVRQP